MYSFEYITKLKPATIAITALLMLSSCSTSNDANVYPPIPDRAIIFGSVLAIGAITVFGK